MTENPIPPHWQWFPEGRFGLFIHWGPYARYARGEQVLFREHLDQQEYARQACAWAPRFFDAAQWAETARAAGCRYAVFTTRHHDGFCMWDSRLTNYTSAAQAAGRDFVREYVEAFRRAGLRVGPVLLAGRLAHPGVLGGPAARPAGLGRFPGLRPRAGARTAYQLRQDRRDLVRRRLAAFGSGLEISRTGRHDPRPPAGDIDQQPPGPAAC